MKSTSLQILKDPNFGKRLHSAISFHVFMASSIDLASQHQWYKVRDFLFFGSAKHDVKRALELAAACQHPEARSLTETFAGKNVSTAKDALAVFLEKDNDAQSLCFAAALSVPVDESRLRRSADLG